MAGALPVLKAAFKRAATAVARVADVVTGAERKRTPVPAEPPSEQEKAPEPLSQKHAPVSVAPVVAVGGRAREGGSMVRQWLAGSELDVEARAKREPSDVVSWLSGDDSGAPREPTLLHGVRAPASPEEQAPEPPQASVEQPPVPAESSSAARGRGSRKKASKKAAPKKKAARKQPKASRKKSPAKKAAAKKVAKKKPSSKKKATANKAGTKRAPAKNKR